MSSVSCSNLGEINYMILGSQVQNYDSLTHLLTRVKSRDASASKNMDRSIDLAVQQSTYTGLTAEKLYMDGRMIGQ